MAEDNEVFIEDDAVVLEDTDNSVEEDADTSKIIPFNCSWESNKLKLDKNIKLKTFNLII